MTFDRAAARQVDVLGRVDIDTPDGHLVLEAVGETVVVSASSAGAFRSLAGPLLRLNRTVRRRTFTQLGRALAAADVEVSFRLNRREIARFGKRSGLGLVARILGVPGLQVRWRRAHDTLLLRL